MVWNTLTSHHFPLVIDSGVAESTARTGDPVEPKDRLAHFETLVRRWEYLVFAVCRHFHPDAESAERTCEDAFLALYRSDADLSDTATHLRGLFTFAIEGALLEMRETDIDVRIVDQPLCHALSRLLPGDREVLLLRFVGEFHVESIASLLEVSAEQIQTRLWNAMAALSRSGINFGGAN